MVGHSIDMQLSLFEGEDMPFDEIIEELDKVSDKVLKAKLDSVEELPGQMDIFSDLDF